MVAAPAGIAEADWLVWPVGAKEFILDHQGEPQAQQQQIEQLRLRLTALATELAQLWERIGRSLCNSF